MNPDLCQKAFGSPNIVLKLIPGIQLSNEKPTRTKSINFSKIQNVISDESSFQTGMFKRFWILLNDIRLIFYLMKQTSRIYTHAVIATWLFLFHPIFILDFSLQYSSNMSYTGCIFNKSKNRETCASIFFSFKSNVDCFGKKEQPSVTLLTLPQFSVSTSHLSKW